MKKQQRNLFIVFFIALAIFLYFYNGVFGLLALTSPGAEPIGSVTLDNVNVFRCSDVGADECVVYGVIDINKEIPTKRVAFRYSGNYNSNVYIDTNGDGLLETGTYSSSGSKRPNGQRLSFNTPNGYAIYLESGGLYIYQSSSPATQTVNYYKYSLGGCSGSSCSSTPTGICPNSNEICVDATELSASFGFCPSYSPNFAFCNNNKVVVPSAQSKSTTEVLIKTSTNDNIQFYPKDGQGNPLTSFHLVVKKYSTSCVPRVQDFISDGQYNEGDACSDDQKLCSPLVNACPSGYTFYTNTNYCGGNSDQNLRYSTRNNVCRQSSSGSTCKNPITDNTRYQKCDGNQSIGASQCGDFNSFANCPSGTQCFLLNSNEELTTNLGTGLGACACPADECYISTGSNGQKIPQRKIGLTDTSYYECQETTQGCHIWSGQDIPCLSGMVFDESLSKCIVPNECSIGDSRCVDSKTLDECKPITIGSETGYQYVAKTITGDMVCDDKGTSDPDDSFSCRLVPNSCDYGNVQCTSTSSYLVCNNPNTAYSCSLFRDITPNDGVNGQPVLALQECVNNQLRDIPDVNCQINKCSTLTDSNNLPIEVCSNNICSLPTDSYQSSEANYPDRTKCIGNSIYKTSRITDGTKIFYRWEIKTDALNTLNGECKTDFACVELLSGSAQCSLKAEFVGIIAEDSYGIGKEINNILVSLTNSVPNRANLQVIARLFDGQTELKRVTTFTNSLGQVEIDFDYSHPRSGELVIDVLVGNPTGVNYQNTKQITIASGLNVIVNCPVNGFVGTPVECTWRVINLDTGNLVTTDSVQISVRQGNNDLDYQPVGTNGLRFTPIQIGSVDIKVTAEKSGFIGDIGELSLEVEPLTQNQVFEVDNKDYFTYSGSGFTSGTHQLVMKVFDSAGSPEKVQSIQATIRTPSGQIIQINFVKVSEGNYKTAYNFADAGRTYELSGTIVFEDIAKESIPFTYSIATIQSDPEGRSNTILIISIVGGIVILIFIIVFILLRRKR